jgi:shikimate kinase
MVQMQDRQHLYLTGYRGTGKSAVGVLLARRLDRPVIDLDQVIEANAGKSIREIFDQGGESLFRELETEALATVSESDAAVISLGGGAILKQQNRETIARTGVCIWLRAEPETIARRINTDQNTAESRPPLTGMDQLAEIQEMLDRRHDLYAASADFQIDSEAKSIDEVAGEVMELFEKEP